MNEIQNYLDAVSQYYTSSERPYAQVGSPFIEFDDLSIERVLQPKLRLLLYGSPGSGKTTFLDGTAALAAELETWIPIFVSLRNYGSTLEDLLRVSVSKFVKDIRLEELLSTSSPKLPLLFLFDGFDEIPVSFQDEVQSSILQLADKFPESSIVITSRVTLNSIFWGDWKKLTIPQLTPDQIHDYILQAEDGLTLWEQIVKSPQLLDMASKPAFLYTILNARIQGEDFRDYLMREIPIYTAWRGHTKSLLDVQVPASLIDKVLMSVALDTSIRDALRFSTATLQELISGLAPKNSNQNFILDGVLSTDVVVKLDDKNLSFTHMSLLESYAARGLLEYFRSSRSIELPLQSILHSKNASQIVRYFLSIVSDDELISLTKQLSQTIIGSIFEIARDVIADRLSNMKELTKSISEQVVNAAALAKNFLENQAQLRKDILVSSVHGFNTRGDWKNRLGFILTQATDGEDFSTAHGIMVNFG